MKALLGCVFWDRLSKAACCLRSMKDTLEHVERELMDMESCCRTALDQAETLNVVYTDAAEEEQAVRVRNRVLVNSLVNGNFKCFKSI